MELGLINGLHPSQLGGGGPSPAASEGEATPPANPAARTNRFHIPMISLVIGALLVLVLLRLLGLTFVGSAAAGLKVKP
jgi:hypothetical protein